MAQPKLLISFLLSIGLIEALLVSAKVERKVYTPFKQFTTSGKSQQGQLFKTPNGYLKVEILEDDIFHFEISTNKNLTDDNSPIWTSPYVDPSKRWNGPSKINFIQAQGNESLSTGTTRVTIAEDFTLTFVDLQNNRNRVHTQMKFDIKAENPRFTLSAEDKKHIFGLGSQFVFGQNNNVWADAAGGWEGKVRNSEQPQKELRFGNHMDYFNGLASGISNVHMPVLYASNAPKSMSDVSNYALFLDCQYKTNFNFQNQNRESWAVDTQYTDTLRFYFINGNKLLDLRQKYMSIVGRATVPPKKMFGLWLSKYGYKNWKEMDAEFQRLKQNNYPVDGFVLDLYWFGGIKQGDPNSKMGLLAWDENRFPSPKATIEKYKKQEGVGIMVIEEAYIGENLETFEPMKQRKGLVMKDDGKEVAFMRGTGDKNWWGSGVMIDWSNANASDFWHDYRRQKNIVDAGVIGHWTDLGEPEMYPARWGEKAWYHGVLPNKNGQADVHNIYNVQWLQSIERGYKRNSVKQRLFIMSRSGGPGVQRLGASMWSGDIPTDRGAYIAHLFNHQQMSFSGIDYYGSDIGGFHRNPLETKNGEVTNDALQETYTQWFANDVMFATPIRPHTNADSAPWRETSPVVMGWNEANRANLRIRYEMLPYYYSLAHRAYRTGLPVFPSVFMQYQDQPVFAATSDLRLVGEFVLVAKVMGENEIYRDVLLPAGSQWINYHTKEYFTGGEVVKKFPEYLGEFRKFSLPIFVKGGAIIPRTHVDDQTGDALGFRRDGSKVLDLIIDIYHDRTVLKSEFTLYEDDGETISYQSGQVRATTITYAYDPKTRATTITVKAAQGSYDNAASTRSTIVRLIVDSSEQVSNVAFNGQELNKVNSEAELLKSAGPGFVISSSSSILVKSAPSSVYSENTYVFTHSAPPNTSAASLNIVSDGFQTQFGEVLVVTGNTPDLGNWDPCSPNVKRLHYRYPNVWSGYLRNLPGNRSLEFQIVKRGDKTCNKNEVQWNGGGSIKAATAGKGFSGTITVPFTR